MIKHFVKLSAFFLVASCKPLIYDMRTGSSSSSSNGSGFVPPPPGDATQLNPACKASEVNLKLNVRGVSRRVKSKTIYADSSLDAISSTGTASLNNHASRANDLGKYNKDVEAELRKYSAKRIGGLYIGKWEDYFTQNNAAGVTCSIFPITSLTQQIETGQNSFVEFSPAMPFMISPNELPEVYQDPAKMNRELNFENITATIKEPGGSGFKADDTVVGSVKISPIAPAHGGVYAFKVESNFKDFKTTQALGILPDVEYHIGADRTYKAIVVKTNDNPPTLLYVP